MDLLDAGRRRWWFSAAAVLLLVAAAVVVVVLWWQHRGGPSPEDTAREFLDATSCARVKELADDDFRARLSADATGTECRKVTDAARGRRTFADTASNRHLDRRLVVGDTVTSDDETQVSLTAHYTEDGRALPPETVVVVLHRSGDAWRVDRWGIAP